MPAPVVAAGITGAASLGGAYLQNKGAKQAAAQQNNAVTHLYDPTNPMLRPLIGQQAGFLSGIYNGVDPFAQHTDPAQTQGLQGAQRLANEPLAASSQLMQSQRALGGIGAGQYGNPMQVNGFSPSANPFTQALATQGFNPSTTTPGAPQIQRAGVQTSGAGANPYANQAHAPQVSAGNVQSPQVDLQQAPVWGQQLGALQTQQANVQANPFIQQMQFSNGFSELQNPFSQMGFANPGQAVVGAAQPIFDRNLRQANTQLANTAPGRFSTAFESQGIDLNRQALDDFNLFASQQLMAGEQLRAQQQAQALQFQLGARDLQQGAAAQTAQAQLGARGLAQDAFATQQGQGLQAAAQNNQAALQARDLQQGAIAQQNAAQLASQGLLQQGQFQNANNSLQAALANQQTSLQASAANAGNTLQSRGLAQDAFAQQQAAQLQAAQQNNAATLQAQQLFQSGQLDAAGLEQQLFLNMQQLGLDANTAAQQARLQAQQIASGAFGQQQQLGLDANTAQNNALLQAQQLGQNAMLGAQQIQISAAGVLGQQAANLDQNAWARQSDLAQLGMQSTQGTVNPLLALLSSGFNWSSPSDINAIIGGVGPRDNVMSPQFANSGGYGGGYSQPSTPGQTIYINGTGSGGPTGGIPVGDPRTLQPGNANRNPMIDQLLRGLFNG